MDDGIIIMNGPIETFMRWWNSIAQRNGKLKFRSQREAADFVRMVQNQNGGPNERILAMRKKYDEVNRAKASRPEAVGARTSRGEAVFQ